MQRFWVLEGRFCCLVDWWTCIWSIIIWWQNACKLSTESIQLWSEIKKNLPSRNLTLNIHQGKCDQWPMHPWPFWTFRKWSVGQEIIKEKMIFSPHCTRILSRHGEMCQSKVTLFNLDLLEEESNQGFGSLFKRSILCQGGRTVKPILRTLNGALKQISIG